MFQVGQGLYGRFSFPDGTSPQYDRAYIIAEINADNIAILNVSTVAGKAHKLLYESNMLINKHYPPLPKSSFVQLDSLTYVPIHEANNAKLLADGKPLDKAEMSSILKAVKDFNEVIIE